MARAKIGVWLKELGSDPVLRRWLQRLNGSPKSTRRSYLRNLRLCCIRYGLTPHQLFEKRKNEVESGDPLIMGEVRDMVIGLMQELTEGRTGDWPEAARGLVKPGPKAPSTARQVSKALINFFKTFGERMEMKIKAKDKPTGTNLGQRGIPASDIRKSLDHAGEEFRLRNRAMVLFLKDSGLRRSDLPLLNVSYFRSPDRVRSVDGEAFMVFDPVRTQKEGIHAWIHVGPEAVRAVDEYLKKERGDAGPDDPLFTMRPQKVKGDVGVKADLRITEDAVGATIKRMMKRGLGDEAKRKSAHSLRKFHRSVLSTAGVSKEIIDKFQGKAVGPYVVPEDIDPEEILETYIRAYDGLRVFPHGEVDYEAREEVERLRRKIQELESRRGAAPEIDERISEMWKVLVAISPPEVVEYWKQRLADTKFSIDWDGQSPTPVIYLFQEALQRANLTP